MTKADIRRLAREAELPVWSKHSYACLATRIPAGTAITARDLGRVSRGEAALMREGLTDFRLRLQGEDALLQVRGEQMDLARRLLEKRHEPLLDGFREVRLDETPRESRET